MSQRVLVCGGRLYAAKSRLFSTLDRIHSAKPISCLIEGEATGADRMARMWAEANNVPVEPYPVTADEWKEIGPPAGPRRNARMLAEGKPDKVIAFPGGKGTRDMCTKAEAAGVPVERIDS